MVSVRIVVLMHIKVCELAMWCLWMRPQSICPVQSSWFWRFVCSGWR